MNSVKQEAEKKAKNLEEQVKVSGIGLMDDSDLNSCR